jgi:hypothetical protein
LLVLCGCGHGSADAPPPYAPELPVVPPAVTAATQPQPAAPVPGAPASPVYNQLPTATEVFNLRSECAKLGEKLLHNAAGGAARSVSQVSNYRPWTNRCYVELTTEHDVNLYDGQTGRLLAHYAQEPGVSSESAATRVYIEEMMKDD